MAASRPKLARIALVRAFEPSLMKKRGIAGSSDETVDQGLDRRGVFRRAFDPVQADACRRSRRLPDHISHIFWPWLRAHNSEHRFADRGSKKD